MGCRLRGAVSETDSGGASSSSAPKSTTNRDVPESRKVPDGGGTGAGAGAESGVGAVSSSTRRRIAPARRFCLRDDSASFTMTRDASFSSTLVSDGSIRWTFFRTAIALPTNPEVAYSSASFQRSSTAS